MSTLRRQTSAKKRVRKKEEKANDENKRETNIHSHDVPRFLPLFPRHRLAVLLEVFVATRMVTALVDEAVAVVGLWFVVIAVRVPVVAAVPAHEV